MTKILGISGKKGSGKSTSCNFLFGREMVALGMVGWIRINEQGRLVVPVDGPEGKLQEGLIDPCDDRPEVQEFYSQTIWPFCKVYQLADPLKWICTRILGLSKKQVSGTNEDKDSDTDLLWSNMPTVITSKEDAKARMTAREVMQYVGTDLFRCMKHTVWIDATLRAISDDAPQLAMISDVRFPDEIEGIQKAGGKVIRFLRSPYSADAHKSENALDNFPLEKYDFVLDNSDMSIQEQNAYVTAKLLEWDFIDDNVELEQ